MLYLSRPTDPSSLPCEIPPSWFDITEEDSVSKQIYKYNMIHGYLEHVLPPEFWGSAFWEPGLIAEVNSLSMSEQEYEQLVNDIHTSIMKIADLINQHSRYVFYSKNWCLVNGVCLNYWLKLSTFSDIITFHQSIFYHRLFYDSIEILNKVKRRWKQKWWMGFIVLLWVFIIWIAWIDMMKWLLIVCILDVLLEMN